MNLPESTGAAKERGSILQGSFGLFDTLLQLFEGGLMKSIRAPIRGALGQPETVLRFNLVGDQRRRGSFQVQGRLI